MQNLQNRCVRHLQPYQALAREIQRVAGAGLGHFHDFGVHVEAGGAAEGDFLVSAAELQAAALGEGLHVGACGAEAASASIPAP